MKNSIRFRSLMVLEDVNVVPVPNNDPKIVLTQPVINFIVPFVPTQLSFSIMAVVSHYKPYIQYQLEIVIINTVQNVVINTIPWTVYEESNKSDVTLGGFFLSNVKNLVIATEGEYLLEIRHNGETLGSASFEVYHEERVRSNDHH